MFYALADKMSPSLNLSFSFHVSVDGSHGYVHGGVLDVPAAGHCEVYHAPRDGLLYLVD